MNFMKKFSLTISLQLLRMVRYFRQTQNGMSSSLCTFPFWLEVQQRSRVLKATKKGQELSRRRYAAYEPVSVRGDPLIAMNPCHVRGC